jgi:hypothetical protein
MTDSTPNPEELAAIPSVLAAIAVFKQFEADIGPDPLQWPVKVVPAKLKAAGALGLLVPGLAVAEGGAVEGQIGGILDGWTAALTKIQAAAAAAKLGAAPAA